MKTSSKVPRDLETDRNPHWMPPGIKDGHHAVMEMSAWAQEDLEKLMSVNSLLCHPQMPVKEETICEDDPEMLPVFSEPKLI